MRDSLFDDGPYPGGRLGFVCVANAGLTEGEMHALVPDGVGLCFTRMAMGADCTIGNLGATLDVLDDALDTLCPARGDLDVICYNCTAGSFIIGDDAIIGRIARKRPNVKATTLLRGVTAALRILNIRKLAIATAYTNDINKIERDYFSSAGFEVVHIEGLGLLRDADMNRVAPAALFEFAASIDRPEADGIFISCGALRSTSIIHSLERQLGKPVIGSNTASLWHCLRLADVAVKYDDRGILFSL